MSDHDRLDCRPRDDGRNPRRVSHHVGSYGELVERHEYQAHQALKDGIGGVRNLAPYLFDRVSDERTLMVAFEYLRDYGGQAPGGDGKRFEDYPEPVAWVTWRDIRDMIREGSWWRGPDRVVRVPKASGNGYRKLTIPCIEDRVVERAVVEIVQPLLDGLFDDHSLGFRPGKGRLNALALAEQYLLKQRRAVWITQDVRDAFDNVPVSRALQIFRHYLPADNLVKHVRYILSQRDGRGLRQGGPLSPLMLNLYLHHVLDRPWRRRRGWLPLIRVADDLLILCRYSFEADHAHENLTTLLQPVGMPLKFPKVDVIFDLTAGASVNWLGYRLSFDSGALRATISPVAWDRLAGRLVLYHDQQALDQDVLLEIIRGWVSEMGPCYASEDRAAVHARLGRLARDIGFAGIQSRRAFQGLWQRAFARWKRLRQQTADSFDEVSQGV